MKPTPAVFGPLSLGLPVLALAAEAASAFFVHPVDGSTADSYLVLCVLALLILGLASGFAGMFHARQMRWLSVLGLGFGLCIVILHLVAASLINQ